jgi:hypothetical protein
MEKINGIVRRGYQVASRPSKEYPYGSLEKQLPYFKALGLDLSPYFMGTLNISIAPFRFEIIKPAFTFEFVEWTDLHPPETFSFAHCNLIFNEQTFAGWVYYPHPETKKNHFQHNSLIEVITYKIAEIEHDSLLMLEVDTSEVKITGQQAG